MSSPVGFSSPTQRISDKRDRAGTEGDAMASNSEKTPMTTRERAAAKHEEKLEFVREQVENGSLVIRQMTDEEREQYPPRPARPKRTGRW
jgi:hypothetical protein